jgi:lipoate---protein ligase
MTNVDQKKIDISHFDFDENLLKNVQSTGQIQISLYPFPETAVVLGRGSKVDVELCVDPLLEDEIKVYRRRGGGCSVVLDSGNLIVSVAMPIKGLTDTKMWFDRCTNWLIDGLHLAGISKVYHDGISDLVIDGRKIAGSAFYRMKGYAYYTVALLVTPEIELMEKYLKHPPREPDYRGKRSHKDFVVAIAEFYPDINVKDLQESLKKYLTIENLLVH